MFEEYNKEYFAGGAKISGYDNYENCSGIVRDIFDLTLQAIGNKQDIKSYLDVGCAYGFAVGRALELGIDAYGIEPPTFAFEQAKQKNWGFRIFEGSLPELKPIQRTYDLITCYEVLEHIPEKDIISAVCKLWELTDKVMCLLPNYNKGNESTHISCFPREWWVELFKELDINKYRDIGAEHIFNENIKAKEMLWASRFFVFKK